MLLSAAVVVSAVVIGGAVIVGGASAIDGIVVCHCYCCLLLLVLTSLLFASALPFLLVALVPLLVLALPLVLPLLVMSTLHVSGAVIGVISTAIVTGTGAIVDDIIVIGLVTLAPAWFCFWWH